MEAGKIEIEKSDFPDFAIKKLETLEITHPSRPIFLRIISRLDVKFINKLSWIKTLIMLKFFNVL